MTEARTRQAVAVGGRYAVVYPAVATGGAYLVSTALAATFGTVLFAVFAVSAVATGFGAMSGSSSNDPRHGGAGMAGGVTPGARMDGSALVRFVLFDVGLAVALTAHAVLMSSGG